VDVVKDANENWISIKYHAALIIKESDLMKCNIELNVSATMQLSGKALS
jgi:hypothetical protein